MVVAGERRPRHPGDWLWRLLRKHGLSANQLAARMGVPTNRVTLLMHGKRAVTADTALRLSQHLEGRPELWMRRQAAYDLAQVRKDDERE